ncbi:unnamed protein product [Miscanthus lutarioriparius]|uniref:Uncharacterized protein n=1 Tax=Miscanthus lutarioriparius TaxID=422564 RepID=A0A811PIG9_9POAL|nr:unnamed protein product [Miscanthus lutarioriparius]CAD6343587.1 unnamed protein product [Miscanthus lutarioriparius]
MVPTTDAKAGATSTAREMQPTPACMDAGAGDEEGREGASMRAFHASDLQDPLAQGRDLVGTAVEVVARRASTLARSGSKRHHAT